MRRRGQRPVVEAPAASAEAPLPPGVPREPKPRPLHPEPMIPAPKRESTALRISYGGCEWCGQEPNPRSTSCGPCAARTRLHQQRMNSLAEREAELRNQLLEQQLENGRNNP